MMTASRQSSSSPYVQLIDGLGLLINPSMIRLSMYGFRLRIGRSALMFSCQTISTCLRGPEP